jgi:pyridinium-3,5-bisthiocarboxylic acid mononucleotide nickel chelatase
VTIAILDPFSGIAGDMTLAALIDCGLDPAWLVALPKQLGLAGIQVRVRDVLRGQITCKKVDFEIPPQPHGRHIAEIRAVVAQSNAPPAVRERADRAFVAIATVEGAIHGMPAERVHLHEVGAVDAILDVLGSIWGFELLGVTAVYCNPLSVGDGTVEAAHGTLPVPAPATLKLLEGHAVRFGPDGSGELVTPTGAALVRVLSQGPPPPAGVIPRQSGYGAGTKDFRGRPNALRIILADLVEPHPPGTIHGAADGSVSREALVMLSADIDDMAGEYIAAAADTLRAAGALDVVLLPTTMKKGRPATRLEVLARPFDADRLEALVLMSTSSIGVRRWDVRRRALPRRERFVVVLGHRVAVKEVTLPDGSVRAKPEHDAVRHVAEATGRPASDIFSLAADAVRHLPDIPESVPAGAPGAPDGGLTPDQLPHPARSRSQA